MSNVVRLRPEADRDVAAAASWYEQQRHGLGQEFLDEFIAVCARLSESPSVYPTVHRSGTSARYFCSGDYDVGGSHCLRFGGRGVDQRFSDELLAAISPLGVEASLEAIRQLEIKDEGRRKAIAHQLEQVEYEARRAFEQYDEVDPRRRLVAAELERRWNEKLQEVEVLKASLGELDREVPPLSDDEKAELLKLGMHLRDVWRSPSCPPEMKKRIVRAVVEELLVDETVPGKLSLIVHWKGGTHTAFEMDRPRIAACESNAVADVELIKRMAVRYKDDVIAGVLNRGGRLTGKGNRWTRDRVASARKQQGIAGQQKTKPDPDTLTMIGAARYCRVSNTTITRLIEAGVLRSRRSPHRRSVALTSSRNRCKRSSNGSAPPGGSCCRGVCRSSKDHYST